MAVRQHNAKAVDVNKACAVLTSFFIIVMFLTNIGDCMKPGAHTTADKTYYLTITLLTSEP